MASIDRADTAMRDASEAEAIKGEKECIAKNASEHGNAVIFNCESQRI
jgi:hypothetical protein